MKSLMGTKDSIGAAFPARRPFVLLFLLLLLALFSPFAFVSGLASENIAVKVVGSVGVISSALAGLSIPFAPRRYGFRVYDSLAILIILILGAVKAPDILRAAPLEGYNEEKQAFALTEELLQHAREHGVDALPSFLASKFGNACLAAESPRAGERSYQARTERYDYTLVIL